MGLKNHAVPAAVFISLGLGCSLALAQTARPDQPAIRSEAEYTLMQLRSDGDASHAALERIRAMVKAGVPASPQWLEVLIEKHQYAEVDSLATQGIVNFPDWAYVIAAEQRSRVEALLKLGKPLEALPAAKGFYNVCVLQDTPNAVNLVARCLEEAYPNDASIVERFKMQQVDWSNATTKPDAASGLGENVLLPIKVPEEPFASAGAAITKSDFASLMGKGNLLLLADHCAEARTAFEAAEKLAKSTDQSVEAVAGIARAIRGQAGAMGPANRFIQEQAR